MDFNAGAILDGLDMQTATQQLLDLIIAVASGQPSKSEAQGVGEAEFNPWHIGRNHVANPSYILSNCLRILLK